MFRVEAASLEEAVHKIFAKAPDMIGPPRIFQAVDGSYECQVEVRECQKTPIISATTATQKTIQNAQC